MISALAIKCEDIMDDPDYGDRTTQWFWFMLTSLRLENMTDEVFDENKVAEILERFITHKYKRNGKGGLFTVPHAKVDMRKLEIWDQMSYYINSIS